MWFKSLNLEGWEVLLGGMLGRVIWDSFCHARWGFCLDWWHGACVGAGSGFKLCVKLFSHEQIRSESWAKMTWRGWSRVWCLSDSLNMRRCWAFIVKKVFLIIWVFSASGWRAYINTPCLLWRHSSCLGDNIVVWDILMGGNNAEDLFEFVKSDSFEVWFFKVLENGLGGEVIELSVKQERVFKEVKELLFSH